MCLFLFLHFSESTGINLVKCVFKCLKGAGTAIGELPPYFMAQAARLSGQIDEEEQKIEDLLAGKESGVRKLVRFE